MRSTWWVLHISELFLNHVSVHMGPGKPCLLGIVFISWREILSRPLMEVNGLMLPKVVLHLWVFEWILSVSIQITITEHNFQVWFWQQFTILRKASEKLSFFFNFNYFVQLEYPMVLQGWGFGVLWDVHWLKSCKPYLCGIQTSLFIIHKGISHELSQILVG